MKKTYSVMGIMSGTSSDGVDFSLCQIDRSRVRLVKMWSRKYPTDLRRRVLGAAANESTTYEVGQLCHDLGRFYAHACPPVRFDFAGIHGQTVYHHPHKKFGATYQIGDPSYLAARFNRPVVSQFRNMDVALGGQGAPLVTVFHKKVFALKNEDVAINNIGGISNVTYLPARGKVLSFDTGPGNVFMDKALTTLTKGRLLYDKNGAWAARGQPRWDLIRNWMGLKYFWIKPPKSTGRETFNEVLFTRFLKDCRKRRLSSNDIVATMTAFTAETLIHAYVNYLPRFPQQIILCGGGAYNPTLRKLIEAQGRMIRDDCSVSTTDTLGWPAQSVESAAFAYLAYLTMTGQPGTISQTTGARYDAVLGQISPAPKNA